MSAGDVFISRTFIYVQCILTSGGKALGFDEYNLWGGDRGDLSFFYSHTLDLILFSTAMSLWIIISNLLKNWHIMQQLRPTLTKFTRKYQNIINKQENNTNRKRLFPPPPTKNKIKKNPEGNSKHLKKNSGSLP